MAGGSGVLGTLSKDAVTKRYRFDEVRAALQKGWGLSLHRGGEMTFGKHDGRWDPTYSKTGFVVGGDFPRKGHSYKRYRSLADVVISWELARDLAKVRR